MKRLLSAFMALTVVATPVAAQAQVRDRDVIILREDRPRRGNDVGALLGGLVIGALVGGAVANSRNRDRDFDRRHDVIRLPSDRFHHRQRVCFEEQIVENFYGRRFIRYEYRCR